MTPRGLRPDPSWRKIHDLQSVVREREAQADGDLSGVTVLIPRAPARAEGLAQMLVAQGATTLVAPVTAAAPPQDPDALKLAVQRLMAGTYEWVVVTSVNAVEALIAAAEPLRTDLRSTFGTRWAAVGPATARRLQDVHIRAEICPDVHSAQGLIDAFAVAAKSYADLPPGSTPYPLLSDGDKILLPLSELAGDKLENGLRALGVQPDVVTAYRTVPVQLPQNIIDAWNAGGVDVVVLTSASVARQIGEQLGPREDVLGVAIGEPSAAAARSVGLRVDAIATQSTDLGLLDAIVAACESRRQPPPHA